MSKVRALRQAAVAAVIVAVALVAGAGRLAAGGQPPPLSVKITSPLGRTGVAGRVRIVAQIVAPSGVAAVNFMVDDQIVGTVTDGPPYAVDWTDSDPFQRRVIVVEA